MKHLVLSSVRMAVLLVHDARVRRARPTAQRRLGNGRRSRLPDQPRHQLQRRLARLELDDDLGIAATFGYRFSERLELQFSPRLAEHRL